MANGVIKSKPLGQSLTIPCECEDTSNCLWYYADQQAVPDHWVQANGDLILLAGNWSVYGGIASQCGSHTNTYTVMNPGT